jgi:hypothetical protein
MNKGFFTDKALRPAENDSVKIIGKAMNNWDALLRHLTTEFKLKGELKFYGINYGWALRFNKSGKSIVALYPNKNFFIVQIILNSNQAEFALSQALDLKTKTLIRDKESIHEGKWIYLQIDQETDLKDILRLIDIRIKVK